MKSARHQLILLGLVSQALSWDDYFLPLVSALLWVAALTIPRRPLKASPLLECALLVAGSGLAFLLAPVFGKSTHFFIGHGLSLLQLSRLVRPLNRREKIFSIVIAFFHIGVACTVILDYRFILLLGFALFLIPRAFRELEYESFPVGVPGAPPERALAPPGPLRWPVYAAIVGVMVLFFLVFPRGLFPATLPPRLGTGGDQGTLADSILDPTRGGLQQSSRVLLHIQGEHVGYLRCFALIDFDGLRWSRDPGAWTKRLDYVPPSQLGRYPHRRVRVKNVAFLGRVLPSDGRVVGLQGKFFRRPMQNAHGAVECEAMWNTANNVYDYWINPKPPPDGLYPGIAERYTQFPPQSRRVQNWLDNVLQGISEPLAQARQLETYFRAHFVYKLGAPELSRLNHVEDFLFNQREGHCERFASTLALLLRMKGIPTRVMVGYLPNNRNWFSGWISVRFSDAHAWTEAYFKDVGWVLLDGTPAATSSPRKFPVRDMIETLDLIWYSNIVNFDAPTQQTLFTGTLQFFSRLAEDLASPFVTGLALGLLLLVVWRNYRRQQRQARRKKQGPSIRPDAAIASRYYSDMLRILARQGFQREPQDTPLEFLGQLRKEKFPRAEDVSLVTDFFCATRYGNHELAPVHESEIEAAIKRMRSHAPAGARTSSSAEASRGPR